MHSQTAMAKRVNRCWTCVLLSKFLPVLAADRGVDFRKRRGAFLARSENRVRHAGGIYRSFHIVGPQDVRSLENQGSVSGKVSIKAV